MIYGDAMSTTMLIPLDGSPFAERAVPIATRLARAGQNRLILAHVASAHGWAAQSDLNTDLVAAVGVAAAPICANGLTVQACIYNGYFAATGLVIARAAAANAADLIVMSSHGRANIRRFVFGSVADEVLRHADVPVLLIPRDCQPELATDHPLRVTIPLDGSPLAEEALEPVVRIFGPLRAELTLVTAVEPIPPGLALMQMGAYAIDPDTDLAEASRYLEATADTLRAQGLQVSIKTAYEPAIQLIQSLARPESTDILAFATHGRGGISRLLFGSVAAAVLAHTTVPVLLVKPAELRTTQSHS
jgi:nucleotide-binding universal stress UspA family protein